MGGAVGEVEEKVFAVETRLTETESAVVDLVIGLEREIAALRRRLDLLEARQLGRPAPGPRLLHDADAA